MAGESAVAHNEPVAKPGCMLGILFGAIIGGLCTGLLFVTGFHLTWNLKSTDFLGAVLSALGVLLAGISVLLALLALALAAAAIYGWRDFKQRTGEAAAQKAQDVAGPVAAKAAVPAAIKQVDEYLDKNLDPEIRQKVIAIVSQIVTPDFIKSMIDNEAAMDTGPRTSRTEAAVENVPEPGFPEEAIKAAATEEAARQENSLEAFDAVVEAEKLRGDDQNGQDEDV